MPSSVPPFAGNISFNAQHCPIGAFTSFSCGNFGTRGGIAAQIGRPANHDLFIGVKEGPRAAGTTLKVLPFFSKAPGGGAEASDFQGDQAGPAEQNVAPRVQVYTRDQIRRHYGWATDRWVTDEFTFSIYTPFGEIPDPAVSSPVEMRKALLPAVVAELVVDNTRGKQPRTAIFAVNFNMPGWRPMAGANRSGFGLHRTLGILGEIVGAGGDASAPPELICRWSPEQGVAETAPHLLGCCPGLLMEVPAGERRVLRISLGCFLDGVVTTGLEGKYLYTRYFSGIEDALNAALDRGDPQPACDLLDRRLLESELSSDQQFIVAHATRSYYGSTQLLDVGGQPFWVVNEGEYCMMNTLDLSVDHMFWELEQNPWVVRNVLDNFVKHYSFTDSLKLGKLSNRSLADLPMPGGISFTHDMGSHNNFSPRGQSSYELPDLPAVCFSHMTAEQLCNWVLMAATYVAKTGDTNWARQNIHVVAACLDSLRKRGGESATPEFDSARCGAGAEITTYDSLDHSLAQTRGSLYMSVKFWASFLGLAMIFERVGTPWHTAQHQSLRQAKRAEQSILGYVGPDGVFPAVFDEDSVGHQSRILPAVEGLLYPSSWGMDLATSAPSLLAALKQHTLALLKDPQGRNRFADGGIKLSTTSPNSWMSKIAIFLHVARRVFHLERDQQIATLFEAADKAHVHWQTVGGSYWACSDQFIDGIAKASRYYPRVITSALWMEGLQQRAPVGQRASARSAVKR